MKAKIIPIKKLEKAEPNSVQPFVIYDGKPEEEFRFVSNVENILEVIRYIDTCCEIFQTPNRWSIENLFNFLEKILNGKASLGEFRIRELTEKQRETTKIPGILWQIIDAGHRTRLLRRLHSGELQFTKKFEIKWKGKIIECGPKGKNVIKNGLELQKQYPELYRERVLNLKFNVLMHCNITDKQAGFIFTELTNSNVSLKPINHLNAKNTAIAQKVRSKVIGENCHPFFQHVVSADEEYFYPASQRKRKNMESDDLVARLFHYAHYEDDIIADDAGLKKMYEDDFEHVVPAAAEIKTDNALTFIQEILKGNERHIKARLIKKSVQKFNWKRQQVFGNLYLYLNRKYDVKISDPVVFVQIMEEAIEYESNPENFFTKKQLQQQKDATTDFGKHISRHTGNDLVSEKLAEWVLNHETHAGLLLLDKEDSFTDAVKKQVLKEQGGKCGVDGKRLSLQDAEGAHIIARSDGILKGGLTIPENCVMIRKKYNQEMTNQNFLFFIKLHKLPGIPYAIKKAKAINRKYGIRL